MANYKQKAEKLIKANQVFGGSLKSRNSLEYGLEMAERQRGTFKKAAFITRPMTNDHCFWDGNKRTASVALLSDFKEKDYKADKRKLVKTLINLSEKREADINKIERSLRRCFKK